MSWVITAVVVVSGVITAKSQKDSAKQQKFELEREAEIEKTAAEGRELQRRQQLNRSLASNISALSQAGITSTGTPQSISLASAQQASISEGIEDLSSRLRRSQLQRRGRNIAARGRLQAASTLLTTAASAAQLSRGSGGSGGSVGSGQGST